MDQNIRIAIEMQNPWWFKKEFDIGIHREEYLNNVKKLLKTPEILLFVGARRTGKSTILFQIIQELLENNPKESILFINMDEPTIQSKANDPSFLTNLILEIEAEKKIRFLFIDEIQNYNYWATTLKNIYDSKKDLKIFLSGSTSTLIKSKSSILLSGRYLQVNVFPLSFKEFLNFCEVNDPTTIEMRREISKYLEYGSFPRIVLEANEDVKREILKNYFQTIYLKDIIYLNKLRSNKDVFDLLYFVISNVGKPLSFNSLSKTLKISGDTIKEYLGYTEESYLFRSINKFDYSLKKQLSNPKKFYCVDTGLVNAVSFKFSEDKGRLFENLVCNSLFRKGLEVYYYKNGNECDFVVKSGNKIVNAIQVTLSLTDEKSKRREIKGLLDAMKEYNLKKGLIITLEESGKIKEDNKEIIIMPIHEWLLL